MSYHSRVHRTTNNNCKSWIHLMNEDQRHKAPYMRNGRHDVVEKETGKYRGGWADVATKSSHLKKVVRQHGKKLCNQGVEEYLFEETEIMEEYLAEIEEAEMYDMLLYSHYDDIEDEDEFFRYTPQEEEDLLHCYFYEEDINESIYRTS